MHILRLSLFGNSFRAASATNRIILALTAAFLMLISPAANAQLDLGRLTGTVLDPSGAAVPSANVTVTNLATHAQRRTQSNGHGIFVLSSLAPGAYEVSATASGFGTFTARVSIVAGQISSQDLTLPVANQTEQVTVNAGGSLEIQHDSHEVRLTLDEKDLTELPNNGLNPLNDALLAPGSEAPSDVAQNTSSGQTFGTSSSQLHLGGGMDSQTGYLQDGVENVTLFTQSANMVASVAAVQGMTVITNGADARYAQPSIVNITTKGGTNSFHGSAFDFLQNDALDAQNYNLSGTEQSKTPLRYNQFGASLGGPILRNRLFFFGSYLGQRDHSTAYATTRVPTDDERLGDYSADSVTLYDPLTYASGANKSFVSETGKNAIPTDRIDPFAPKFLAYVPTPNIPFNAALNINYQTPLTNANTFNQYLGRADWNLSSHDQAYVAGGYSNRIKTTPSFIATLYGNESHFTATNAFVEEIHTFSTRLLNTARIGYNRSILLSTVKGVGSEPYYQEFGLKNLNPAPQQWAPPSLYVTGYFAVGNGLAVGNRYAPQGAVQNRFQYADEIDYQIGKHSLSFGGEFIRSQIDGNWTIQNNGYYTFNASMTGHYSGGKKLANGDGVADLLLGFPTKAAGATGVSVGAMREWQVVGYLQDYWKLTPSLTLSLGIRYDFDNPPNDKNGASSVYDLPSNRTIAGTWNTNYRNVSPRLGFAFSPERNTAIHGGFGIYYAGSPYNYLQFLLAHPPNFITQSLSFNQKNPTSVTDVFSANPSAAGQTPQTLGKSMPDVYVEQFNLFVERKFHRSYSLSVGYAGQVGRHSSVRVNANQPNAMAPGSDIYNIRPYSYAGDVFAQYNIENSNSNGLLAKFIGHLPGGSRIITSYTWSKSMNTSDGDRNTIENYYHPEYYYAVAAWDRTNHLNIGSVNHLPFGRGQHWMNSAPRWVDMILGQWQMNGIYRYATGLPITITAANTADSSGIGTYLAQKVCDPTKGFQRSLGEWFNTACFVQPDNGQYGRGGRNSVRQPNLNQLDLSLVKAFAIREQQSLQLRLEGFNALNHPQFSLPGSVSVTNATYGVINGTSHSMRVVQVAMRYSF